MSFLAVAAAVLAGAAAGTGMLRRAWQNKAGKTPWRMGGLALLAFTVIWPAWPLGPVRGPFISITLISLAAWAVVSSGYKRRPAKAQRAGRESLAPEPAERLTTKWRTTLRWLLAGPIGMVAAMAVGISYTVWAPGADQTRLLIGALIVPVAWGGAMAWTLADNRIVRATAVLTGTAVIGFGLSMLKGFA